MRRVSEIQITMASGHRYLLRRQRKGWQIDEHGCNAPYSEMDAWFTRDQASSIPSAMAVCLRLDREQVRANRKRASR